MTPSVTITNSPQGGFTLHIPSTSMGTTQIEIPFSFAGLKVMHLILQAREAAQSVHDLRIGTKAQPTQSMVEAWLRANKATKPEVVKKKKPSPYGIDLEGIEL